MVSPSPAPQGNVPIVECVREGFGFLARDWRMIVPVALIGAAGLAPLQVWAESATAAGDGGGRLLATGLSVLVQIPLLAAFYRRTLSRGADPLSLRIGADEFNLAGTTAALGFFFFIVVIVGVIFISTALAALASGSTADLQGLQGLPTAEAARRFGEALGAEGQAVLVVSMLALAGVLLWLSARLALAYPATVASQRVMAFSTWGWTKGNVGAVMAALLLTVAIGVGLSVLVMMAPGALLAATFGNAALTTPATPANWIASYLGAAAGLVFFHAPYTATTAYLHRGLRPQ